LISQRYSYNLDEFDDCREFVVAVQRMAGMEIVGFERNYFSYVTLETLRFVGFNSIHPIEIMSIFTNFLPHQKTKTKNFVCVKHLT
jgi:hypothetical protein